MSRPKHKLVIRYKSGREVRVRADEVTVTRRGGGLAEVKWDTMQPRPLHLGVDEIESIWQVK